MLTYYLELGSRGLRHNFVLTALMILAIAMGVAASMTVLTALRDLSADPIPAKAHQLYSVRIDNWGPGAPNNAALSDLVSYPDAVELMRARAAPRQSAMYEVQFTAVPEGADLSPIALTGRAVSADFFGMFDAPMASGRAWSRSEDDSRADVVVLGATAATRLFPGADAVGKAVTLDGRDYRVVGVLRPWHLQPRVYDLSTRLFQETEDVFLPFTTAVGAAMETRGGIYCAQQITPGFDHEMHSECRWLQFWVQLPTDVAVRSYRAFLDRYAGQQRRTGRFHWLPTVSLLDVEETLEAEHMVPNEMRICTVAAFGFLLVCLVNATGLMLSRLRQRVAEFSVRRALGAGRLQIFAQCVAEGIMIGVAGGLLGLALTMLGLAFERAILREDYAHLIHLDPQMAGTTFALAVAAMLLAALFPGWNATRGLPAWHLRQN